MAQKRIKNCRFLFVVLFNALEFTQRNFAKKNWIGRRQTTTGKHAFEHAFAYRPLRCAILSRWAAAAGTVANFKCVYDANGTRTILFALEFTIAVFSAIYFWGHFARIGAREMERANVCEREGKARNYTLDEGQHAENKGLNNAFANWTQP